MIGKDGLENQKDINKELDATQKALREANAKAAQLTEESRSLTEELRDQLGIRSRNNEGEKTLLSLSQSITKSAQENKVALRESGDITKQLGKDEKTLEAAKREQLILTNSILGTDKDLNKLILEEADNIVNANSARTDSISKIDRLKQQLVGASKEEEKAILSSISTEQEKLTIAEEDLSLALEIARAEAQQLALGKQLVIAAGKNVAEGVKQEESQNRINKSLGVAGGLAKAFKGAFGGLAQTIGMDQVAKDMEKFATEAEDAGKSVSRLQVLGVGMVSAFKGLGNTLTDPSFLLTNLIKGFNEVDKAATDFQQQTGQDLNTMSTSWDNFNLGLITTAEYMKAASEITKEFGVNAAAVFTPENLIEAASMTKEMGLSGKEAANLARLSKVNGGNIEAQNEAIISGINSANRQNKTAVAHGQALRDVANVSEGIAISYAGYPDKLGAAATAAAGLGMNLSQVDKIAGSLLDFQSSIEAEMEAELLTGRSLNLEKARQLALDNDLAGVATELANQGITSTNFSKMNRIQQEAQAKALGMNRDEMARMLLTQEMQGNLSEDALNDAQKATLEDMKRVDAQEKFATAIAKLQQALAPIVGFFADIASQSWLIYSVMGVAVLAKMPMLVSSVKGLAGGFGSAWKNAKGLVSGTQNLLKNLKGSGSIMGKMYKGGQFMPGGGRAAAGGQRAGGLMGKIKGAFSAPEGLDKGAASVANSADKTKGIDPKQGSGIKEFLEGLGDGLASIGEQAMNVFKGGLALGGALLAMGVGMALAMPLIAGSDPVLMLAFAASISAIGLTVAVMGKMGGDIIKGALALGIMAIALIPAAYAFSLLAGVDASSILAFSIAIPILGLSVLALGLIFTNPVTMFLFGAGILGLVSLGLAILPLAAAFSILKDVDIPTIGAGLMSLANKDLIEGLSSFGIAISSLATPLLISSIAFAILGPALQSTAIGFEMLAASNMIGTVDSLQILSTLSPGLMDTSKALLALAGSLTAVGVAGILAIPAMAIMSLFGGMGGEESSGELSSGESSKEDGGMAKINANLEKLIALISAGGDVYIDGAKVGKTVALATSRMG